MNQAELALPLDAANKAPAREKSIGRSPRRSLPDRLTWAAAARRLLEDL